MTVLSNSDALLVAVPMIGLLVVCYFRLDELVGKPRKPRKASFAGREFARIEDGRALSLDPPLRGEAREVTDLKVARGPRVRAEVD